MSSTPIPVDARPLRLATALSALLLLASVGAVILQHASACGNCAMRHGPWQIVAPMGALAYAALTIAGCLGSHRLLASGSAVAAGIHTVLVAAMLTRGQVCLLCVVAAALAIALFFVMLVRSSSRLRMIACLYVPAALVTSGPTAWALAQDRALEGDREAFVRAIHASRLTSTDQSRLAIEVFEQDHCGYCRDFREFHLPRLERDFGDRIRVQFVAATAAAWVRRTPTIAIEGGPVYEGLPADYSDLRSAVEQALAARK